MMVSEGKARLFKRKDGKYLIYLPVDFAEDSMFPFKNYTTDEKHRDSMPIRVRFDSDKKVLIVEKWPEEVEKEVAAK